MCVIIACTKALPTQSILNACEKHNGDGGGMAYIVPGVGVRYEKGLTAKAIDKRVSRLTEANLPVVIHFRIATSGGKMMTLCHPFVIGTNNTMSGEADSVLFHNGHWKDWEHYAMEAVIRRNKKMPPGRWSDSRAIAWLVSLYGKGFMDLVSGFNKFALLEKTGKLRLVGHFSEHEGMMFSNLTWQPYVPPKYDYRYGNQYAWKDTAGKREDDKKNFMEKGGKDEVVIEGKCETVQEEEAAITHHCGGKEHAII